MKIRHISALVSALTVATTFGLVSANKMALTAPTFKAIGLTANNTLVRLDTKKSVQVTGLDGNLKGIDFRPANGKLYGLTDKDKVYTIDPNKGSATLVSTLSSSFDGGFQSGIDFNPVVDRLRIDGSNGQNFRTNVDNGSVNVDKPLAYAANDPNAGKNPNITAIAYTNNRAGVTATQLFVIDYDLDVLALQNPPNDGTLNTIGSLGINLAPVGGFDIFTDKDGKNTAFALSGTALYTIDLSKGTATKLSNMSMGNFIGLAVISFN